MTIRNDKELKLFEKIIDRCRCTVFLVLPCGTQYDLKKPVDRYLGIAEMLKTNTAREPEIFATCYEDEINFFEFLAMQESGYSS